MRPALSFVFLAALFMAMLNPVQAGFKTDTSLPPPEEWAQVDLANWKTKNADDMMGLFQPLFGGYAEFDGAKTMTITINETPDGTAYEVFVTQSGYADDSVSGGRWAATVKPQSSGWAIETLWRQQLCARGAHKEKWTKQNCP